MTADPFSHPWLGALFGDAEIAKIIGPDATLGHMISIEAAYSRALCAVGAVDAEIAEHAARGIEGFEVDLDLLRRDNEQDGVPVPSLSRQIKAVLPKNLHVAVHKGMTSQDVVDTALVLSLKEAISVLETRVTDLSAGLDKLDKSFGANKMAGRTRMQLALEISVSDRIRSWASPLAGLANMLAQIKAKVLVLQLGGPVGNRKSLGPKADEISAHMAAALGLFDPKEAWHSNRMGLVEFTNLLSLVTGHLGKMGQDIALMAQQGLDEVKISGGGASSAMPHKQNPVKAELLVTLAQYNATQMAGLQQAMLHEQERSGAAWALEWLLLPGVLQATGRSLTVATELIASIEHLGRRA